MGLLVRISRRVLQDHIVHIALEDRNHRKDHKDRKGHKDHMDHMGRMDLVDRMVPEVRIHHKVLVGRMDRMVLEVRTEGWVVGSK